MGTFSTRAKWRTVPRECCSVLGKCLTPPTLLERRCFASEGPKAGVVRVAHTSVIYGRSPFACFLVLWFGRDKAVLLSSGELLFPLVVRAPYPPLWRFCSQVLRRADDQLETEDI
jgi:hypothetical protein